MVDNVSTPQHCPGYADFKNLKALVCKCSKCGQEKEIFSDEFDRPQFCRMRNIGRRQKRIPPLDDRCYQCR